MFFCRRWLLIFSALVLSGAQVFAANSREDRAFAAATAAFQDGLYDRAETEFAQFILHYPNASKYNEAVLALAQAQYQQGKFTVARDLLTVTHGNLGRLADRYAYWLGEAQFAQGDYERAASTFTSLAKNFPESSLRLTAVVEAAAAFERLGDWPQLTGLLAATNGVFAHAAQKDATNELVSRGWLLLAQSQLAQENFSGALATLKLLSQQTLAPDLDLQRANLLCRVQVGAGDLDAALATSTNLLQLARMQKDAGRLADSVAWHGTVLERMGRWPEAASAWSENLTNTAPVEWQHEAILKIAGAAAAQKNFAVASSSLEKFLVQFSNSPAADLALLTLGELQLKSFVADPTATNQLALAHANFDQLLAVSTNGPLSGKAFLDRGWCRWLTQKTSESVADFQAAAARLPVSEDLAVAQFKTGDALFELKDFSGAQASYQALLDQFRNVPDVMKALGDRALYQILRANIELRNTAGAEAAMHQLLEKFPASELADNGQLLLGEGLASFGATTNAFNVFREFEKQFPDSPLTPQVGLARARAFEREQNWPAAITNYADWVKNFPTNDLLPQVQYALGWANFQAGRETNAFTQFAALVARFPTNELAPLAQWWVADYYFRLGGTNFLEAEKNYELIFQTPGWGSSTLFYPAQLMAGRAAAGRLGFRDAVDYLTKLISDTNCPPTLATQAKFVCGGVLMRMDSTDTNHPFANFELAANIFSKLLSGNPTNELGALAASELGDCQLQLGAFDAATNAYGQVMNSPYASVGLRSRAQVGVGRVLEKKAESAPPEARPALLDQARGNYLDAFETGYGKGLSESESANAFWVKKAGLLALPLLSSGSGYPTNFFTRMESLLPTLKDTIEKKRAALKN